MYRVRSVSLFASLLTPLASLILAAGAAALTLHDNGDPTEGFGVAILSEASSINQVGDDFSLGDSATLTGFSWWGDGAGDDFSIRIHEITGGTPSAAPLAVFDVGQLTGTPQSFPGSDLLFYSAEVAEYAIDAGDYLLSIVERGAGIDWFWAASCEDDCLGTRFERSSDGLAWSVANFDMSFHVIGRAVPEPSPMLLCGVGLVMLHLRAGRMRVPRNRAHLGGADRRN